ncbi:MAG TPA: alpha/beta hydrolase [Gammaproteobacteria bacterium]|nr:alpha/beta hydrolase [Gammaproteobacteria bacterium]
MRHEAFWLTANDETKLYVNHWASADEPRAIVMIAHGLAEHGQRYARFARALSEEGVSVFALDQRGHGQTAGLGTLGFFSDKHGWDLVVNDLSCLNHHIRVNYPNTPIFLLGHSMGSYIALAYLMQHSCSMQGAILSGSNYFKTSLRYRAAMLLACFEHWRLGAKGRSALLDKVIYMPYQRAVKQRRTDWDWLSRDTEQVDAYINDPLCGFTGTTQLWLDLLGGLQHITPVRNMIQIDNDLPLLIIGGDADPINHGHRLIDLANALRESGNRAVDIRLYRQGRHEVLQETNHEEVTADIMQWLNAALANQREITPTLDLESPHDAKH